jgi:hypothetical protein
VEFTISALRLTVRDPSHWQVLGPLLWAEIERAHVMARRGRAAGVQERELHLDGRIPAAETGRVGREDRGAIAAEAKERGGRGWGPVTDK